jgi:hypothetical protein
VCGKVLSTGILITSELNRLSRDNKGKNFKPLSMIICPTEYSHNDESLINSTQARYLEILQRFVRRSFEWMKLFELANIQSDQQRQTLTGIIADTSPLVTQHSIKVRAALSPCQSEHYARTGSELLSLWTSAHKNIWLQLYRLWFLGAFAKLRKAAVSFVISVRPSTSNNWVPTKRIIITFDIWVFFQTLSRRFKFH